MSLNINTQMQNDVHSVTKGGYLFRYAVMFLKRHKLFTTMIGWLILVAYLVPIHIHMLIAQAPSSYKLIVYIVSFLLLASGSLIHAHLICHFIHASIWVLIEAVIISCVGYNLIAPIYIDIALNGGLPNFLIEVRDFSTLPHSEVFQILLVLLPMATSIPSLHRLNKYIPKSEWNILTCDELKINRPIIVLAIYPAVMLIIYSFRGHIGYLEEAIMLLSFLFIVTCICPRDKMEPAISDKYIIWRTAVHLVDVVKLPMNPRNLQVDRISYQNRLIASVARLLQRGYFSNQVFYTEVLQSVVNQMLFYEHNMSNQKEKQIVHSSGLFFALGIALSAVPPHQSEEETYRNNLLMWENIPSLLTTGICCYAIQYGFVFGETIYALQFYEKSKIPLDAEAEHSLFTSARNHMNELPERVCKLDTVVELVQSMYRISADISYLSDKGSNNITCEISVNELKELLGQIAKIAGTIEERERKNDGE